MGLHRLLQRAFARLYKYDLPQDPVPDAQSSSDAPPLSDFDDYMDGVRKPLSLSVQLCVVKPGVLQEPLSQCYLLGSRSANSRTT